MACLPQWKRHDFHVCVKHDVEFRMAFLLIIDGSCTSGYGSVPLNAPFIAFGCCDVTFFGFIHGGFQGGVGLSLICGEITCVWVSSLNHSFLENGKAFPVRCLEV